MLDFKKMLNLYDGNLFRTFLVLIIFGVKSKFERVGPDTAL